QFTDLSDYCRADQKWALLKLNGSVSWGQRLRTGAARRVIGRSKFCAPPYEELRLEREVTLLFGHGQRSLFNEQDFYFPTLAIPMHGQDDLACPHEHMMSFQMRCPTHYDLIVFGFSGGDRQVVELVVKPLGKFLIVNGTQALGLSALEKMHSM